MKKSTHRSKREMKAAIKRRLNNQLKFLRKESAVPAADSEHHHHHRVVDRISELPDEILISILSRLTLPQAIATSVLSTRWRYLHTYIDRLKFPPFQFRSETISTRLFVNEFKVPFSNYKSRINRTLDSYRGVLKEFSVDMWCLEGANIERCLEFALGSSQVEIIDLRLHYVGLRMFSDGNNTLQLSDLIGQSSSSLPGLKCLKQMFLHGVQVDDLDVQLLVSNNNFPLLESLTIEKSARLENVSVVGHDGPMPNKLKHLHISDAENLKSIEIRDMINLVSLKLYGYRFRCALHLNNIPKLTEFNIRGLPQHPNAGRASPTVPSCLHDQLRLLTVWTWLSDVRWIFKAHTYELINVKHLEITVTMDERTLFSHRELFPLIEACRSLEKLDIEFLWNAKDQLNDTNVTKVFMFSPHKKLSPKLKRMTISGYLGNSDDLGFVLNMMKHAAASLEEVIIEPCNQSRKIRRKATVRALKQFKPVIPNTVSLKQFGLLLGFVIVCGLLMYYVFMYSLGLNL